jgi:hypothetical protein
MASHFSPVATMKAAEMWWKQWNMEYILATVGWGNGLSSVRAPVVQFPAAFLRQVEAASQFLVVPSPS